MVAIAAAVGFCFGFHFPRSHLLKCVLEFMTPVIASLDTNNLVGQFYILPGVIPQDSAQNLLLLSLQVVCKHLVFYIKFLPVSKIQKGFLLPAMNPDGYKHLPNYNYDLLKTIHILLMTPFYFTTTYLYCPYTRVDTFQALVYLVFPAGWILLKAVILCVLYQGVNNHINPFCQPLNHLVYIFKVLTFGNEIKSFINMNLLLYHIAILCFSHCPIS